MVRAECSVLVEIAKALFVVSCVTMCAVAQGESVFHGEGGSTQVGDSLPSNTTAISTGDISAIISGDNSAISTGDIAAISTGDISAISTGDTSAISTGDIAAISTGDIAAISTGDIAAISTGDIAAISTGDIAAISTGDIAAISTGDIAAISTGDIAAISTGDIAAISTGDIAAISAGDIAAISTGDIAAISTGDIAAISTGDVAAISIGDTEAISVGDVEAISIGDTQAISIGDAPLGTIAETNVPLVVSQSDPAEPTPNRISTEGPGTCGDCFEYFGNWKLLEDITESSDFDRRFVTGSISKFGYIRAEGTLDKNLNFVVTKIEKIDEVYVPGASEIRFVGLTTGVMTELGQIRVGDTVVDVNAIGADAPKYGDYGLLTEVIGVQPVEGGVVLATEVRDVSQALLGN